MPLSLVVGPAHSGKIGRLLDGFVAALDRDPWLIVPNRADVERIEHELLDRSPALFAGSIGTFDDLFAAVLAGSNAQTRTASEIVGRVVLQRVVADVELAELGASAAASGFVDVVGRALGEASAALVAADALPATLARIAATYQERLAQAELVDRDSVGGLAVARLQEDLAAWSSAPVFAYGFEDLTQAEWAALEALSARTQVMVSLPYEPGRPAFASLEGTSSDLAVLAKDRIVELQPGSSSHLPAALAHLERHLFEEAQPDLASPGGAVRLLEGAGTRGTLELVAQEILELHADGIELDEIGIVCDSVDRLRGPLEAVMHQYEIPFRLEASTPFQRTPLGAALLALLRFAGTGGTRGMLFGLLRSPYSGLPRATVDFLEGRLRGRAVSDAGRVEEEAQKLRGEPLPLLDLARSEEHPVVVARNALHRLLRNAHGLDGATTADAARDGRAAAAALAALDELERLEPAVTREELLSALGTTTVSPSPEREGRVAVLDLGRVRTRRFDTVFVLGLEEGILPRRGGGTPLLPDDVRSGLGRRLERPDPVSRDRYLLYTACTRPRRRLVLAREAAGDDGTPTYPSPFWQEVTRLFDRAELARATRRRVMSELTFEVDRAPTERERLRAAASLARTSRSEAVALAEANGWSRRLERARSAFTRETRLRNPSVLEWLAGRTTFSATELERFADCSSAWLVERVVAPKTIDAEPDAMLRGQVAHTALHRFAVALPKELKVDRVDPTTVEAAVLLMRRCVDDAVASGVRLDVSDVQLAELASTLHRDLEALVRDEAEAQHSLIPRRFEVGFGSERAAQELQRGLSLGDGLTMSGKIDRVDIDMFSAQGIVVDYKSGKGAHSAVDIERERRLQIPLYMLVLRDLLGIEPLGGVYQPLAGRRTARGMLRQSAAAELPGFQPRDFLEEDEFWRIVEGARAQAGEYAQRIRAGDVRHDPRGDGCPAWCDLWTVCRVGRQ
ncbi:MAG: PD-(D/E)XK nuclease family protein [Gaiella sp.]